MTKTLDRMLNERSAERAEVDKHKRRMLEEVRDFRLREVREALDLT